MRRMIRSLLLKHHRQQQHISPLWNRHYYRVLSHYYYRHEDVAAVNAMRLRYGYNMSSIQTSNATGNHNNSTNTNTSIISNIMSCSSRPQHQQQRFASTNTMNSSVHVTKNKRSGPVAKYKEVKQQDAELRNKTKSKKKSSRAVTEPIPKKQEVIMTDPIHYLEQYLRASQPPTPTESVYGNVNDYTTRPLRDDEKLTTSNTNGINNHNNNDGDERVVAPQPPWNNPEFVQYNGQRDHFHTANAARDGNLPLLKWLRQYGCPFHQQTTAIAAQYGYLDVLEWCHEHACPWDIRTCAYAADNGDLVTLRWLRDHGGPWDATTMSAAAAAGHGHVLEWAHAHGCPVDTALCAQAARHGQWEILQWAYENDIPWDQETPANAALMGHWEILQWLHRKNCPWDESTCANAARSGHLHILD